MGTRHNRKLDQETAEAIRREYTAASGRVTYLQIAQRLGVSEGTVSRIIRGATYREAAETPFARRAMTSEEVEAMGRRLMRVQEEVNMYGVMPVAGMPKPHVVAQAEGAESPFDRAMRMMEERNQESAKEKGLDNSATVNDNADIPTEGTQPGAPILAPTTK